jgi:phenylacetate-CoA ligase
MIKMTLIGRMRWKALENEIKTRIENYDNNISNKDRLNWQLNKFNSEWKIISKHVPYYKKMLYEKVVPEQFESWDQFRNLMPIIDRKTFQSSGHTMSHKSKKYDYLRVTSGSTGEPIKMPSWRSEIKWTRADQWVGRSRYGIRVEDHCFYIWGHSHLLGTGFSGVRKKNLRILKDKILGYYRFSAYNLTEDTLLKAGDALLEFKPKYIIGYSNALDMFSRVNIKRADKFKSLNLKVVIATSENFPFSDSSQIIEKVFGAPVAMEYGSVETDAIAYTNKSLVFNIFWRNYFIEVNNNDLNGEILVTSLYPRCTPLIRYKLGDLIELTDKGKFGINKFNNVIGRNRKVLTLKDGTKINTAIFSHSLRDFPEVLGFQIVISNSSFKINIFSRSVKEKDKLKINLKNKLKIIHPDFEDTEIEIVRKLKQNKSGKTPVIIYE